MVDEKLKTATATFAVAVAVHLDEVDNRLDSVYDDVCMLRRGPTTKKFSRAKRLWILTAFLLTAGALVWVVSVCVYPPYSIVDLTTIDGQAPLRIRANDNGDLAISLGSPDHGRLAILKTGRLHYLPAEQLGQEYPWPSLAVWPSHSLVFDIAGINNDDEIAGAAAPLHSQSGQSGCPYVWRGGKFTLLPKHGSVSGIDAEGDVCSRALFSPTCFWLSSGEVKMVSIDSTWPKCLRPAVEPSKAPLLSIEATTNGQIIEPAPYYFDDQGIAYCTVECAAAPNAEDEDVNLAVRSDGTVRIVTDAPEPTNQAIQNDLCDNSRSYGIIEFKPGLPYAPPTTYLTAGIDTPKLSARQVSSTHPDVGTVLEADRKPFTLSEYLTLSGWRRLFGGTPAAPRSRLIPDGMRDVPLRLAKAAVRIQGEVHTLNTLTSPLSGWTLLTAQHIDNAGRILCVGRHNAELSWCMLVPRGKSFLVPN